MKTPYEVLSDGIVGNTLNVCEMAVEILDVSDGDVYTDDSHMSDLIKALKKEGYPDNMLLRLAEDAVKEQGLNILRDAVK